MPTNLATNVRADMAQAIITRAGTGAKLKAYSGTRPAGVGAPSGTMHEMFTWPGGPCGVVSGVTVDFDEAGATCVNTNNIAGTPTFYDLTTSADVVVARIDGFTRAGPVVNGATTPLSAMSLVMPGA